MPRPETIQWCEGLPCCDTDWERAYRDFETPEEEREKFKRRYRKLGIDQWPRDWQVVDLFCGRGNGLAALTEIGFTRLEGVDLSPDLLAQYDGPAQTYVGDCRALQFPDASKDAVIIQGGLHHLPELPEDMDGVLAEVRRVLRPTGRFVLVEPWLTPYLQIVHAACEIRPLRRVWSKLDAVARMNECEWTTYDRWLRRPDELLQSLESQFMVIQRHIGWGKLMLVAGKP